MVTGQVDATIIDQPVAVDAVEKTGGNRDRRRDPRPTSSIGYALSKENTALLDAVNTALQELKDDGTVTDIYQQYFQSDPPESVLTGTTTNPG